jgi:anaerobic magnesium-protoporphyrin IX monomethyl ester cyclase
MSSILFCVPDGGSFLIQTPIGVLYTATLLSKKFKVGICDFRLSPKYGSEDDFRVKVKKANYIVIPTTLYQSTQCYDIEILRSVRKLVRKIKEYSSSKIILVGSHGTVWPKETLNYTGAGVVVRGEFEKYLPLFFKKDRSDTIFPSADIKLGYIDPNSLPVPNYSLLPIGNYFSEFPAKNGSLRLKRSALLFGNRGCPFSCSYCYNFFGKLRIRDPKKILKEMITLIESYGIKYFFFLDYTFTSNRAWVRELCSLIKKTNYSPKWVCQTRLDAVDFKLLKEMYTAGCQGIWFGVEHPNVIEKGWNKQITRDTLNRTLIQTRKAGIEFLSFVILSKQYSTRDFTELSRWITNNKISFVLSILTQRPLTVDFVRAGRKIEGWDEVEREWSLISSKRAGVFEKWYKKLQKIETYQGRKMEVQSKIMTKTCFFDNS